MSLFLASSLLGLAAAQSVGEAPEVHPKLTTWKCTVADGCTAQDTAVVIDSLSHPVHQKDDESLGCGDWGNPPNTTVCPDLETCQENCIMEGVEDYESYGIYTDGGELRLRHLRDDGTVASPRVYLLNEEEDKYEMLRLTGMEMSFDVDVSKLPCGMNGALYLSEMEEDGGLSELNTAGPAYGTGYCDAQCYVTPFVNGVGNIDGKGVCCNELDIWEANARATHLAPHPCNQTGLYTCTGPECEQDGVCDKDGCSYNPYRVEAFDYYGPELRVDTSRPFTVVTQFPADEDGNLVEIRRLYVQDGKVIQNAKVEKEGLPEVDFMNDELCAAQGADKFADLGALKGMGEAMTRGMVLCMSVWWDEGGNMEWLDSGEAGPCEPGEGAPENILEVEADPDVVFSNIKWGEIGSTFEGETGGKCKAKKH
ncbi:hypothetical protein VUR80DRAFT_6992 [Thermomyces stellatus]